MGMDHVPNICFGTDCQGLNGLMAVFAAAGEDVDHGDGLDVDFPALELP